ncbi:MAG TPA: DNA-directed RNA polymerase subunit omega [Planctomycetota bacterium]|nr:DNA-directed RNA polymerase subunit omega [Planctomycetota bacterium]
MLDIDLEEELVRKVGGKFALTYLLQRRMVELNRGERPLIELDDHDSLDNRRIACREILEGKIALAPRAELESLAEERRRQVDAGTPEPAAPPAEEATGEQFGADFKRIKEQRIKELSQLLNPNKK